MGLRETPRPCANEGCTKSTVATIIHTMARTDQPIPKLYSVQGTEYIVPYLVSAWPNLKVTKTSTLCTLQYVNIEYLNVNSNDIPHPWKYRCYHQSKQNTLGRQNSITTNGERGANGDVVPILEEGTSAQKQELVWNYLRIEFLFLFLLFYFW